MSFNTRQIGKTFKSQSTHASKGSIRYLPYTPTPHEYRKKLVSLMDVGRQFNCNSHLT